MSDQVTLSHQTLVELDAAHKAMFIAITDFFRYAKRHPEAKDEVEKYFDDAYFARVADALHARVDHEIKHLHSPYLD